MPHPAITRDPRPATAIAALRAARFHVRRKGYDIAEVDRLLQRCLQSLERLTAASEGEPDAEGDGERAWRTFWEEDGEHAAASDDDEVAALIAAAQLPTRRKGYDQGEVDALLAELAAILTGPVPAGRAAGSTTPVPTAAGAAVPPLVEEDAAPARSAVVVDAGPADAAAAADGPLPFDAPAIDAPRATPAVRPFTVPLPPPPVAAEPAAAVEPAAPAQPAVPASSAEREGLEDQLVRQVVDASLQTAQELADGPGLRREAERLLEQLHEARLAEIGEKVERECRDLREAAVDQCTAIVTDARAEADRMLAIVARRVEERLEQVRHDAADELDRILAEERRGLAEAEAAAAPEASVGTALGLAPSTLGSADRPLVFADPEPQEVEPVADAPIAGPRPGLPRRPRVDLPFTTRSWDLASVDRHGAWDPSLYPHESAPTVGGASDVEEHGS